MVAFGIGRRHGGMAPAAFVAFLTTEIGEFRLLIPTVKARDLFSACGRHYSRSDRRFTRLRNRELPEQPLLSPLPSNQLRQEPSP